MFILNNRVREHFASTETFPWDKFRSFLTRYREVIKKVGFIEVPCDVIDELTGKVDHKIDIGLYHKKGTEDVEIQGRGRSGRIESKLSIDLKSRRASLYLPQFHARMELDDQSKKWSAEPGYKVCSDVYEIGDDQFNAYLTVIQDMANGGKGTAEIFEYIMLQFPEAN